MVSDETPLAEDRLTEANEEEGVGAPELLALNPDELDARDT